MYRICILCVIISSFILPFVSAKIYNCSKTREKCKTQEPEHDASESLSNDWDYLTFAQQWPPTFCLSQTGKCKIPADVRSWTIHGLWPSAISGKHPECCYYPQVFDDSSIQAFMKQLNQTWPNLLMENPFTKFWEHEWCKHGTCAENSAELKGEVNYFQKGLDLHNEISIDNALESENIFPGKNYSLLNVTNAIIKKFNVQPKVFCFYDSEDHFILQQIEVCLSKDLKLMDCPGTNKLQNKRLRSLDNCSSKHDLVYPPFEKYSIVMD